MQYNLRRAQEIVDRRCEVTIQTPPAHVRKIKTFYARWTKHISELKKSRCVTDRYVRTMTQFLAFNEQFMDKPTHPRLGVGPTDALFMTALEMCLHGRYCPATDQAMVSLDPAWFDIWHAYLCRILLITHNEERFVQHTTLLREIFVYESTPVFPKSWVDSLADLMTSISVYLESDLGYESDPWYDATSFCLRTFHALLYLNP